MRAALAAAYLALALFASSVLAQTALPLPACEPAPVGKGTYPYRVSNDAGEWSVYWCSDKFAHTPVILAKTKEYRMLTPSITEMAGKTMAQVYREIWTLNVKAVTGEPVHAALIAEAETWAEANKPAAPYYAVAPNSTAVDRPAYTRTAAGARSVSAIAGVRALIGAECLCGEPSLRVDSAAGVYCPWLGAEVEPVVQITLCRLTTRP